jgi:tetratricopeptide (TPR) repeat protein
VEVVTVGLELTGAEGVRPFIEAAAPQHPSLVDTTHQMDELFGVINIPSVIWIDEEGVIVRPAESGWPGPVEFPAEMRARLIERARQAAEEAAASGQEPVDLMKIIQSGQDRATYPDAIRDWVRQGAASQYAMTPDEVVEASQPRRLEQSEAAAHFELANHLWRSGDRDAAIRHFNECHRLQPNNWTYKRQAWSLVGEERVGGELGRFAQSPLPGEEADWPFISNFDADVAALEMGGYYPKTI